MTTNSSAAKTLKSLAQTLYEASPSSGWSGPWRSLGQDQVEWWTHYAAMARRHVLNEIGMFSADANRDESDSLDSANQQFAGAELNLR